MVDLGVTPGAQRSRSRLTHPIQMRVSEAQWERWSAQADADDVTVTAMIRRAVDDWLAARRAAGRRADALVGRSYGYDADVARHRT